MGMSEKNAAVTAVWAALALLLAFGLRLGTILATPLQEAELPMWNAVISHVHMGNLPAAMTQTGHVLFQKLVLTMAGISGDNLPLLRAISLGSSMLACILIGLALRRVAGAKAALWAMVLFALWPTEVLWGALLTPQALTAGLAAAVFITAPNKSLPGFLLHLALLGVLFLEEWASIALLPAVMLLESPTLSRPMRALRVFAVFGVTGLSLLGRGTSTHQLPLLAESLWPSFTLAGLLMGALMAGAANARTLRRVATVVLGLALLAELAACWFTPNLTDWRRIAAHVAQGKITGEILVLRPELALLVQAASEDSLPLLMNIHTPAEMILASEAATSGQFSWVLDANPVGKTLIEYLSLRGIKPDLRVAGGAPRVLALHVTFPHGFTPVQKPRGSLRLRNAALESGSMRLRFLAAQVLKGAHAEQDALAVAASIPPGALPDEPYRLDLASLLQSLGDNARAGEILGLDSWNEPVNDAITRAYELRNAGRREEAIALLQQTAAGAVSSDLLLRMLGDFLQEAGQTEAARESYGRIAESSPHYAYAQAEIGRLLLQSGDLANAITTLEQAVHIAEPGEGSSPVTLAEALVAAGRGGEIQQLHQDLTNRQWPTCITQVVLALGAEAQGDSTFAISLYSELIEKQPDCVDAYGRADALLERAATRRNRIAFWEHLTAKAPENARAHFHHGLALGNVGMLDEAAGAFTQAVILAPADPGYLTELAAIRLKQGQYEAARRFAESAIAAQPTFTRAHQIRIAALKALGNGEALQRAQEEALRAGVTAEVP